MIKRSERGKSVIKAWVISYVVIFILPLCVMSVVYSLSIRSMRTILHESGSLYLDNVSGQLDSVFSSARSAAFELGYSCDFDALSSAQTFFSANPVTIYRTVDKLSYFNAVKSEEIDGAYIYFENINAILTDSTSSAISRYYDIYYRNYPDSRDEWLRLITGEYAKSCYVSVTLKEQSGSERTEFYYIQPGKRAAGKGRYNIIMRISAKTLKRIIDVPQNEDTLESALAITDGDKILLTGGGFNLPYEDVEQALRAEQNVARINGTNYIIMSGGSSASSFRYLMLISQEKLYTRIQGVLMIVIISAVGTVLMGAFMIIVLIRHNYNPIRRLIGSVSAHVSSENPSYGNEYQYIESGISRMGRIQQELSEHSSEQGRVLRSMLLAHILLDKKQMGVELLKAFALSGFEFAHAVFAVIAINAEDPDVLSFLHEQDAQGDAYRRAQEYANIVIERIAGAFFSEDFAGYFARMDGATACLLNFKSEEDYREKVIQLYEKTASILLDDFSTGIAVAASDIFFDVAEAPRAYDQTVYAMEQIRAGGKEKLLFFRDMDVLPRAGAFYYPATVEKQITVLIENCEFVQARNLLNNILEINFKRNSITIEAARILAADIVSTLMKTIDCFNAESHEELYGILRAAESLFGIKYLDELSAAVMNVFDDFSARIQIILKEKGHLKVDALFAAIEEYVYRNYGDPNLSCASIAEKLGISPVFATREMKKTRGVGLLDFINRYRTEKAMELIRKNPDSVLDVIALKVGFNSTKTLTRCFKKYAQTTPGKFRSTI